jgi:hypothetical protein
MKPFRTNKIRSILSFLGWLISDRIHSVLPSGITSDPIELVDISSEAHAQKINYCCKLDQSFDVTDAVTAAKLSYFKKTGYSFDLHRIMAPFQQLKFTYLPGDIKHVPDVPTVVRSRPIGDHNQNSILLPLNSRRLFEVYPDPDAFEDKKSMIVWRGAVHKEHRAQLLEACESLPFCDIAASFTSIDRCKHLVKNWLTPQQQMTYKYLFIIEGNDIASNIQWAMNSNSLCMMRKPRYESWFAEGLLKANVHYVEIAEDFSDIDEKFRYYEANPEEAKAIIKNSNAYVRAQQNIIEQYALGRQVMRKYAKFSSQTV